MRVEVVMSGSGSLNCSGNGDIVVAFPKHDVHIDGSFCQIVAT